MFKLLKGGNIYSPQYLGAKDILVALGKIVKVEENISVDGLWGVETIDCTGKIILPGIIDQHLHIIGGGGEKGPSSRIPEIYLTDIVNAGITTVVGVLGFDGLTRNMAGLLAKAKSLEAEGVNTFIYTGSYGLPTTTLTGKVISDITFIDKVIGAGEIAISDYRSSHPDIKELKSLAYEVKIGSMISNKAGVVHIHVGDGKDGIKPLKDLLNDSEFPIDMFVPTHINRNKMLFEQGLEYLKTGGNIDLTAGSTGGIGYDVPDALSTIAERKLGFDRVTISSDANGSIPDVNGQPGVGKVNMLIDDIRSSILQKGLKIEDVFRTVTSNVAQLLKIYPQKGVLKNGSDADILVMDEKELKIFELMVNGISFVHEGKTIKKGSYEN
ncbi:beta-aspartyl-peptidase [Pseudobacteroides cellulosolvens]|uniref:Isoaspartyl dipeptidase n=1 Tax=Pseudobacteroides cellulosolvens ATCC 35603 = DSM 2933 TaxID=398512 RepID=A0A0L6JTJ7_9FIRM|nr:beta-aspartyl-peptidase [Pseudobacteroides cellulosolvens]KNY28722.1 isoaspartyl dipeptidase [Pseudobacteroides cellulosolvens ATCC 35603 = DSM 2933]